MQAVRQIFYACHRISLLRFLLRFLAKRHTFSLLSSL